MTEGATAKSKNDKILDLVESQYIDPEKDETHVRFKTAKKKLQEQGLTLRKGDQSSLHPHSGKQAFVDFLRFIGAFVYLVDLCVKIAYFINTKWISTQVRELWWDVFRLRVAFILFYHFWFICFSFTRNYGEHNRAFKEQNYDSVETQPDELREGGSSDSQSEEKEEGDDDDDDDDDVVDQVT